MLEVWDLRFLNLAKEVSTWSRDPTTKVGAVIVDTKRRVVSLGYNGFPRGVYDFEERLSDRETKHKFTCHAERNALDQSPINVEGCTLYSTLYPCHECAKGIVQRGIVRVVSPRPERKDDWNWQTSREIFSEARIEIHHIEGFV